MKNTQNNAYIKLMRFLCYFFFQKYNFCLLYFAVIYNNIVILSILNLRYILVHLDRYSKVIVFLRLTSKFDFYPSHTLSLSELCEPRQI